MEGLCYFFSVISFIFVFGCLNFYSDYGSFPYHIDEWHHISIARSIAYNHRFDKNPYSGASINDYEIFYHLLLSFLYWIFGSSLIVNFRLLAVVNFSVVLSILFYYLWKKLDFWLGISVVAILLTLKTNLNLLGVSFFVPFTFSFVFIVLDLVLQNKKYRFINAVFAILFYPPIGLIISLLVIIDFYRVKKDRFVKIAIMILLSLISLTGIYYLVNAKNVFAKLVFGKNWSQVVFKYNLLSVIGVSNLVLLFVFSIFVIFYTYRIKRKSFRILNHKLMYYVFVLLVFVTIFYLYGIGFLIPPQRSIYLLYFFFYILSGVGLYFIISLFKVKKNLYFALSFGVIFAFFYMSYVNVYFNSPMKYDNFFFNASTYGVVNSIGTYLRNYSNVTVIAPPYYSSIIYPITGVKSFAIVPAQLSTQNVKVWSDFYSKGCGTKQKVANSVMGNIFVVSLVRVNCPGFELLKVYNDGYQKYYFYNVNKKQLVYESVY